MIQRLALLAMAFFLVFSLPGHAQQAPPAGLSQQEFDRLVGAISDAVVKRLSEQGEAKTRSTKEATAAAAAAQERSSAEEEVAAFLSRLAVISAAWKPLADSLLRIPGLIEGREGGRSLLAFAFQLLLACALALLAERAVRHLLARQQDWLAGRSQEETGWRMVGAIAGLAGLDALGLAALWIVSHGIAGAWFPGADPQARLAALVLTGLFAWRLYVFCFGLVMRPDEPRARLVRLNDGDAATIMRAVSGIVLVVIAVRVVLRVLFAIKAPGDAIALAQLIGDLVIFVALVFNLVRARTALSEWFASLAAHRPGLAATLRSAALPLCIGFFLILTGTLVFGAVMARFTVGKAMILTVNVIIGLLLIESALQEITRRFAADNGDGAYTHAEQVLLRCGRVALLIGGFAMLVQSWAADVLDLDERPGWGAFTGACVKAGITLFAAYVAWELVRFFSNRIAGSPPSAAHGEAESDDGTQPPPATRLSTVVPLLRVAAGITIAIVAALLVLSHLGVNITPLIAGASVLGLAVSFGSQTLVRDIVSGVFYLADDAFRVGEYIDCGKAKGTVESFTLRSIKLRHQNGQVHTIPFGQLGQITNFSRDWTTVKFNLRFARDTDIEKLRKAVKQIGLQQAEEAEFKADIMTPLKMQGVADITDTALVVRFKFMVRPTNPSLMQRDAIKRMIREFPALGINFANAYISVQTMGSPEAAGAAAAQMMREQPAAVTTERA